MGNTHSRACSSILAPSETPKRVPTPFSPVPTPRPGAYMSLERIKRRVRLDPQQPESVSTPDFRIKLLLIGDESVGKTALLRSFLRENADEDPPSTFGVDFKAKRASIDHRPCKLHLWDTPGKSSFRSLTSDYYKDVAAVIFVYDATKPESFENVRTQWIKEFRDNCDPDKVAVVLCGNRRPSAENDDSVVSRPSAQLFANSVPCRLLEVDAKNPEAADDVFIAAAWDYLHHHQNLAHSMALPNNERDEQAPSASDDLA